MALNEPKLYKKMSINLFDMKSYIPGREDRIRHGGGAAVYIRDSIKYSQQDDVPSNDLEFAHIEVQLVKASLFLGIAWYRPSSEPVASFEKFEQVLRYLKNEDKKIILLGDINYNLFLKESHMHNKLDPFASSCGDQ